MTSARQREWRNESNLLTPAASSQVNVGLATNNFEKGQTLVRTILRIGVSPVTVNVVTVVTLAGQSTRELT